MICIRSVLLSAGVFSSQRDSTTWMDVKGVKQSNLCFLGTDASVTAGCVDRPP
jgi:hypothetical protein